ncbi:hypothetical protein M3580_00580 [Bacillus safensis]|uniref:hypothetical protein n=1 Tax=Bacillus safensis TaxID=561879 RepID=UPI00203FF001|nr:hypothetical protein [Bacillus safensis]
MRSVNYFTPAAIIAIVLVLGKIDTPVTNILFYVVAFNVMDLTVSSLIKQDNEPFNRGNKRYQNTVSCS